MAAYIFAKNQYHLLAGNRVVKNGVALRLKSTDKIVAGGRAFPLGFGSASIPEIPEIPEVPEAALKTLTHENGTEPVTGTAWYITPDGAGTMNGSGWADAASGSMIHVILLQCASGDRVYFAEGAYAIDRTIALPENVSLFGGFSASAPSWAARDAFSHPTVFTGDGTFAWGNCPSGSAGQLIDGFTLVDFADSTKDAANVIFRNGTLSGGTFAWSGALYNVKSSDCVLDINHAERLIVSNTNAAAVAASGTVTHATINTAGAAFSAVSLIDGYLQCSSATIATAVRCEIYGSGGTTVSASHVNVYGSRSHYITWKFCGTMSDCTATYCNNDDILFYCHSGGINNCTAINCSTISSPLFDCMESFNCAAINCSTIHSPLFECMESFNCKAINCKSISELFSCSNVVNCAVINCSLRSVSSGAKIINCIVINCDFYDGVFGGIYGHKISDSTVVNCNIPQVKNIYPETWCYNCLSWNNSGSEFVNAKKAGSCAGSDYNASLSLFLGIDNTIARFTNTGFAPVKGVQDVGECPNPLTDPEGYAAYIASFGDWRPLADSFLVGAGTATADIVTDLNGVSRPDPPTIGAYEPQPATGA